MNFSLRRRIERIYQKGIQKLFDSIFKMIQGMAPQTAIEYLKRIGSSKAVRDLCDKLALTMVTAVRVENANTWREAARKGTFSRQIYHSLRQEMSGPLDAAAMAIVRENSKLISSVPAEIAEDISKKAFERYMKGERWESVYADLLARAPGLARSRAKLIARTESSKANSAMVQVRSENIGSHWYIWRGSKDERERHSHLRMEGVVINWNAPPDPEAFDTGDSQFGPYHAGCCPNCRCWPQPIVDTNDLPDSFRVCLNGQKPRNMSKSQFLSLIGN